MAVSSFGHSQCWVPYCYEHVLGCVGFTDGAGYMWQKQKGQALGNLPQGWGLGAIKRNCKGQLSGVPCPRLDMSQASSKEVNSDQDEDGA